MRGPGGAPICALRRPPVSGTLEPVCTIHTLKTLMV